MISEALDYAALGWAVFPCWPGSKEPATPHGFKDATTNPAKIRRWWSANPDYNIAVATGLMSGLMVLDPDGAFGAASLQELEAEHGPLPDTLISITGRGSHFWFRITDPVPSPRDGIGHCLDVKADGGYIVAPPSTHPDGGTYRWSNNRPIAPAPDWLLRLARQKKQPIVIDQPRISDRARMHMRRGGAASRYAQAALESEIDALAHTPQGTRNHALNSASFSLHQLVAGGELDGDEVHARLIEAAHANGLMADPDDGPRKTLATIASGARAGLQHPRNRRGAA